MNEERKQELQRLCDAATPGPWRDDCGIRVVAGPDSDPTYIINYESVTDVEVDVNGAADIAFVAAARAAVPELMSEVEQLQQSVDEALGPHCTGCGNAIDPDTCHCGSATTDHNIGSGHSAVPLGCDCHHDTDWRKVANTRAVLLSRARRHASEIESGIELADATNERLKADLREATDTLATAQQRILDLEVSLHEALQAIKTATSRLNELQP